MIGGIGEGVLGDGKKGLCWGSGSVAETAMD